MPKRGGGRFGKYGDLKRKDKIRQNRLKRTGLSIAGPDRDERKALNRFRKREQ